MGRPVSRIFASNECDASHEILCSSLLVLFDDLLRETFDTVLDRVHLNIAICVALLQSLRFGVVGAMFDYRFSGLTECA